MQTLDITYIHAPATYDFRERSIMYGPVSDMVPSTPIFEMYPLGLTTLSILNKAVEYIHELYPQRKFELERIPIDDPATYEVFQLANTEAIFQFESDGMRSLLKQAQPDRLEDLVALNALYRPGPMDLIPSWAAIRSAAPIFCAARWARSRSRK